MPYISTEACSVDIRLRIIFFGKSSSICNNEMTPVIFIFTDPNVCFTQKYRNQGIEIVI